MTRHDELYQRALRIAEQADVTTTPDRVVLYSVSYQPTRENRDRALRYVEENPGHVVMEMTGAGSALESLALFAETSPLSREEAYQPWFKASHRLVEGASGNVTVFVENADSRSTFVQVELPCLIANGKIATVNGTPKPEWIDLFILRHPHLASVVKTVQAA